MSAEAIKKALGTIRTHRDRSVLPQTVIWLLFLSCILPPAWSAQANSPSSDRVSHVPSTFEIASIRPTPPGADTWQLEFTGNGFRARGVTLRDLIHEAFKVYEENRLTGGPKWAATTKFDITARVDSSNGSELKSLSLNDRCLMLRNMLQERMSVKLHEATVSLPVYALQIAKGGPKMKRSEESTRHPGGISGVSGLIRHSESGHLDVEDLSMKGFAEMLSTLVGRTVVDQTALTDHFDFSLHWSPRADAAFTDKAGEQSDWPALGPALHEQLGLTIVPTQAPVQVIVLDSAEMPSPN